MGVAAEMFRDEFDADSADGVGEAAMPADGIGRPPTKHDEVLIALADAQRLEVVLLQTRIEQLSAILREHGIELRDDDPRLGVSGEAHLQACRRVVSAAYDLLGQITEIEEALLELRGLVGAGMELVGKKKWRE